ncbi:Fe-S cluster assembly ATPase SufC [Spirochaetia bacterium 38H-sp]|uniref:Fe-S cluster assembly ATPase SufC n=1 Tax=Rarispira pelagica TaxID=3141764 RepID=A0ABU9UDM3_9SPIR
MAKLEIRELYAEVEGNKILKGVNLVVNDGEIHALMGPNGSGKSTLANVIMGHPSYIVTSGSILWNGDDITALPVEERARAGIFLGFQYPVEVPGLTIGKFIKRVLDKQDNKSVSVSDIISRLKKSVKTVGLPEDFINRSLNDGFSGGEKKRMEIVQMLMMQPKLAMLDEIDSGLDIDALKDVSVGVNSLRGGDFSALIITHYQRILEHISPDYVHIMYRGNIVRSGGRELVELLEREGYESIRAEYGIEESDDELVKS